MSSGGFYNICLLQGDTYAETFVLRHKIVVASAAVIGDTILNVSPIPHSITSGSTFTFGAVVVTLSASASTGDRTLQVNAISGSIAKSSSAKSALVDLTGKSARASIRKEFSDSTALGNFICSIASPPTLGEVTLSISSSVSAALPANTTPGKVRLIEDLQSSTFPTVEEVKALYTVGMQPAPYYYDLEIYDTGSPPVVTKYVRGRVIIQAEATK